MTARKEIAVKRSRVPPRLVALTAGVIAVILYGSLFPFRFYDRGTIADAVRYLFSTAVRPWDRGDALANVLLYLPLGLFGARVLRNIPGIPRILIVAFAGAALSVSIEITQFFDLSRATELSDVVTNIAGTSLGAVAELGLRNERFPRIEWRPFAIVLLTAVIATWLYPFMPSFDLNRLIRTLHASWIPAEFEPLLIFKQTLFWLITGLLLESLGGTRFSRIATPLLAICVIAARFAIPGAYVARADVAGAVAGPILWSLVLWRWRLRVPVLALLFAGFVVVDALRPFTFLTHPRSFGWTPFVAFINGPRGSVARIFIEKTFIYGALVWLFVRSMKSWALATIAALAIVLATRIAQVWLPGRSAEITDPVMVLMLALVLRAIED